VTCRQGFQLPIVWYPVNNNGGFNKYRHPTQMINCIMAEEMI